MRLPYWTEQLALEGPIKAEKAFCQKKILGSHPASWCLVILLQKGKGNENEAKYKDPLYILTKKEIYFHSSVLPN